MKERTVRISDLFWGVLSHWKALIIFIIIGAVLGAGYSYLTSGKSKDSESAVTMKLTQEDKNVIALYLKYTALYDDQLNYIQSDNLMQIDPANTYRCSMIYYLGCENTDKVDGLVASYQIRLDELSDKYGKPNSFTIKKNQNTLITDDFTNVISTEGTNAVISVVVYGTDPANCTAMLDETDNYIFEKRQEIEETFGPHTLTSFRGEMSKAPTTGIITRQKDAVDTLNAINTSLTNIRKNQDEDFLAVLEYCAENYPEYKDPEQIPDKINTGEKMKSKSSSKGISAKMIVLGALAGFVIGLIIFAIAYSLRSRLAPEDDLEEIYGIPMFASASQCSPGKKNGVDRAIDRKRRRRFPKTDGEGEIELAASNIRLAARAKGTDRVYVSGSGITEAEKAFIDKVAGKLKDDGCSLVTGRSLLIFPEALEDAAECGNVVLVEKVGVSKFDEIISELRKCADNGINVLGMIKAG